MSPSPLFTVAAPLKRRPAVLLAAIGLVVVAITGRTGDVMRRGIHGVVTRPALALCVVVVFVVIVTVAQHVSGGGSRARPAAGTWSRRRPVRPRARSAVAAVLPAVTVVLMGWWALRNIPSGSIRPPSVVLVTGGSPMPELLQVLPASPGCAPRQAS